MMSPAVMRIVPVMSDRCAAAVSATRDAHVLHMGQKLTARIRQLQPPADPFKQEHRQAGF